MKNKSLKQLCRLQVREELYMVRREQENENTNIQIYNAVCKLNEDYFWTECSDIPDLLSIDISSPILSTRSCLLQC